MRCISNKYRYCKKLCEKICNYNININNSLIILYNNKCEYINNITIYCNDNFNMNCNDFSLLLIIVLLILLIFFIFALNKLYKLIKELIIKDNNSIYLI